MFIMYKHNMELNKISNLFVKKLLNIDEFVSYRDITTSQKMQIYKICSNGFNYSSKIIKDKLFNSSIITNTISHYTELPIPPEGLVNRFISEEDKNKIFELNYYLSFTVNILNHTINVHISVNKKSELNYFRKRLYKIITWLYIAITNKNHTTNCSKTLNIYLYMINSKKVLEHDILDSVNINSGYSNCCTKTSNIVIFRKEEWFKLLIHECMHSFGLDFCEINTSQYEKSLQKLFNVNCELLFYESYCEFWAIIMNCALESYFITLNNDFKDFENCYTIFMNYELHFSYFQVQKILLHNKISYSELINNKMNHSMYKENTNVFCYYIIKTLLITFQKEFINQCNSDNYSLLQFNGSHKNIKHFINFIEKYYNNNKMLKNIKNTESNYSYFSKAPLLHDTMRMTVIEEK